MIPKREKYVLGEVPPMVDPSDLDPSGATRPHVWLRLTNLDPEKYYSARAIWAEVRCKSMSALMAKLDDHKVPWVIYSWEPRVKFYKGKHLHKIAPYWASIHRGRQKSAKRKFF